jgi:hypothetical protein
MTPLFTVPSAWGAPGCGAVEGEQAAIAKYKEIMPVSLKMVVNEASLKELSDRENGISGTMHMQRTCQRY